MRDSALRRGTPSDIAGRYNEPPSRAGVELIPRHVPVYLPEIFPIPSAVEFNPSGSVASVGAEVATAIPLLPTIQNGAVRIPDQNVGIIRGFSIFISNMLTTTVVSWTLLVNGAPAGGYGTLTMFPRAASFVGNSFDCFIRLPDGAQVGVQFTNTDGGTYTIGASLSGWYWPVASGMRWLEKGM